MRYLPLARDNYRIGKIPAMGSLSPLLWGCALAVIGSIRRRGVLFVLACLPDGSRALIPAQWTDWDEGHCGGVRACREANVGSRALGSLGDLLQLRHLVDALRVRSIGVGAATEGEPSCN